MSRQAVSCEHLAIFAHFEDVSFWPSSKRFSIICWCSFAICIVFPACRRFFRYAKIPVARTL